MPKEAREPDCTSCPYIKGNVYVTPTAYSKITALMEHFDVEWLGYLIGKWEGDNVHVTDLSIPEQKTTGGSVDHVEGELPRGHVGVIHSHVRMGAFFSGTDDTWINDNHNVSIVVSKKNGVANLDFKTQVRKKVPCGANMLMEMNVVRVDQDQRSWLQSVVEKVKSYVYRPSVTVVTGAPGYTQMKGLVDGQLTNLGAIERDTPPRQAGTKRKASAAVGRQAYNRIVKAVAEAEGGTEGVLKAIGQFKYEDLDVAADFIVEKEGSMDLLKLIEDEIDARVLGSIYKDLV